MELKYIWIKEFRNIRETGFSFDNSDGQQFEYADGRLNISAKQRPPNGFFGDTVKSCTAIVGQNGSGKTSLTDFILHALAGIVNGGQVQWYEDHVYQCIVVYGHFIEHHASIPITNASSLEQQGYEVRSFSQIPFTHQLYSEAGRALDFFRNKFIYFSPGFSGNTRYRLENAIDVSTDYLVYDDARWQPWENDPNPAPGQRTFLYHYEDMEAWREANFVFDHGDLLPFEKPARFSIRLWFHELYRLFQRKESLKGLTLQVGFGTTIANEIIERAYEEEVAEEWGTGRRWLKRKDQYEGHVMLYINMVVLQALVQDHINLEAYRSQVQKFIFDLNYFPDAEGFGPLNEMKRAILALRPLVPAGSIDLQSYNHDHSIQITTNTISTCISYTSYRAANPEQEGLLKTHIFGGYEYLKSARAFQFGQSAPLSAGEKSLLTFYARLYHARNTAINDLYLEIEGIDHYHIKLFLDEPDIHMHPEWQRRFFKDTLDFVTEIFKDFKVQLFITSHSPLILSDIPAANAIILEKDRETGQLRLSDPMRHKTFASNIHALYSNQFFMKSTIGAFAAGKIQEITRDIAELHPENEEATRKLVALIEYIGEPVIRETLRQQLEDKLRVRSQAEEQLQREIIRLQRLLSIHNILDDDLPGNT